MIQILLALLSMIGVPIISTGIKSRWVEQNVDTLGQIDAQRDILPVETSGQQDPQPDPETIEAPRSSTDVAPIDETVADALNETQEEPPVDVVADIQTPPVVDQTPQESVDTPVYDQTPVESVETPVVDETPVETVEPPVVDQTPEEGAETPAVDQTPIEVIDTQDEIDVPADGGYTPTNDGATIPNTIQADGDEVITGRVTTLEIEGDVSSVKIISGPEHGNITVNPDNTLALVLSDTNYQGTLHFGYEVTFADGTSELVEANVTAVAPLQEGGWGLGNFYELEVDENDETIVEFGDNHREVYISGSDDALSKADIAAIEGLNVSDITTGWLAAHSEYGGSEDMALDAEAGMDLWYSVSGRTAEPNSNWLLFERGYEYGDLGRIIDRGVEGESPLHPMYVGSYGEGELPVIDTKLNIYQENSSNIVIQNVAFAGSAQALGGSNIMFDGVLLTGEEANFQNIENLTFRNSSVIDAHRDAPTDISDGLWNQSNDRMSGVFIKNSNGVLLENNYFDHNGWADGYDYNLSAEDGQPPSYYSHNVYVQKDSLDVTFRDNISMRAASFGAQIRPGGFIEGNVFIDNNAAVMFFGGTLNAETGLKTGNYTLFSDNVITSGAHKEVLKKEGALTMGVNHGGEMAALVDNIVAHLADPNNPDEQAAKTIGHDALNSKEETVYNDTVVYNWIGQNAIDAGTLGRSPDTNIDGLNTNVLDQTTIQVFTAQLLGQDTATIADLADYLRAQASGALDGTPDADLITKFFQTGFGLTPDLDTSADTLRFVPDALGDGMRWDNLLNWDLEYLPQDGQNIDLAGNWVHYAGAGTNTMNDLDFGDGGKLIISSGKLTIEGDTTAGEGGAAFEISNAGQVWINGYSDHDQLTIEVDGGRFANTGDFYGNADATLSDGQMLLGASGGIYDIANGAVLRIEGDDGKIGFDGVAGHTSALRIADQGTLNFTADESGISAITEFRSGAYGTQTSDVQSGAHLDGHLVVDLSGYTGAANQLTLIEVDELIGDFDDVTLTGLATNQDATVLVDYDADTVTLQLTNGTGQINHLVQGTEAGQGDMSSDLWEALTGNFGIYDEASAIPPEDLEPDLMFA